MKYVSSGAVTVDDIVYHPNCFTCKRCDKKLARAKYYKHEGKYYCDRCVLIVNPTQVVI